MTVLLSSWLLVAWAGGPEELSRIMSTAGTFTSLVVISGLVELAFLTVMVCHTGNGRVVPLAVMLGMATLPWTVGLLGTETVIDRTFTAIAGLEAPDARTALALGVAEAMAARMLGAWMSMALLMGLGLGLAMTGASSDAPWRSAPRGTTASLLFGIVVAFVLAALALVGAMEAHQLFTGLTRLVRAPLPEHVGLLSQVTEELAHLRPIRQACEALLLTLGGVLLVWQLRRATRPARGWMGSAFLVASVTALLVLDGHPLRLAELRARNAGLDAPSLPRDFQTLSTPRASTPRPLVAVATLEGLLPTVGSRLSWSAPARTLAEALSASLHSTSSTAPRGGATPEPVLPLLVDARLSGASVRHLIQASALAGARSVELVGQQPHAASPATLEWFQSRQPLFSLLAARAGMLQLLLPAALPTPSSLSWRARLEKGGRLSLSPLQGGVPLTLSVQATLAEIPADLAGTFVGLELSDDVSLKELGAAAEVLALAGASAVALLEVDSAVAGPAQGGTEILWSPARWSAPAPGLPSPELLRRGLEVKRYGWEALRKASERPRAQAPRRQAPRPVSVLQRSQTSSAMATNSPNPNTTSIMTPSPLEDGGTFGAASESGFISRNGSAVSPGSRDGSAEGEPLEASLMARPSRASASTRFMWSM